MSQDGIDSAVAVHTHPKSLAEALAEHPFVRGLAPAQIEALSSCALRFRYEPGEMIFSEDDPANRFYLIETGHVSLETRRGPRGQAMQLEMIGPGDVLGWSWLFPPHYWHFDARAIEPVTAIFFYGTRLRERCEEDHDLGYEMMKRMAGVVIRRLQAARHKLAELESGPAI